MDKSIGSPDYEKYNHLSEDSIINRTIWVYWAQGLDNAPPVVQNCVKTLKENSSPDFVVQVVDDFNLVDYIDIPEIINTRLKEGVISRTHFSDIVRFELLKKHGGVWIDSTVLVAENFRGF
ncbi:capsular polysaccharide synthesis protein [Klebsiella pneumoniae]|uniref:capsular polysaccharide synthesis protein n=1 Tax=Klebsiella pneumoniae TaxID=573 RepID=UPI00388D94AD